MNRLVVLAIITGSLVGTRPAWSDPHTRAEQLVMARGEVQELSEELDFKKDAYRGQIRSLDAQRIDLEMQLARETLSLQQVKQAVDVENELGKVHLDGHDAWRRVAISTGDQLKRHVNDGIPFRRDERLQAVEVVLTDLAAEKVSPAVAVTRLWQIIEDEKRLSTENALHRQVIALDGEPTMVDVARLGLMAMAFQTTDGQVGVARKAAGNWQWVIVKDTKESERLTVLFDALRKNVRTGWFALPEEWRGAK